MHDYETAKAHKIELEEAVKKASALVSAIPGVGGGPMGLTPDRVKFSPEFIRAKEEYSKAFKTLQIFNLFFTRNFKTQYTAERNSNLSSKG